MEFESSYAISISEAANFSSCKLSGSSLRSSVNPEELAKKCGTVVRLSLIIMCNSLKKRWFFRRSCLSLCLVYYSSTFYTQMSKYASVSYTYLHPIFSPTSLLEYLHIISYFFLRITKENIRHVTKKTWELSDHSHVLWLWSYWKHSKKVRESIHCSKSV